MVDRKETALRVSLQRLPDRLGNQKLARVYQLLVPLPEEQSPIPLPEERKEVSHAPRSTLCPRLL